MADVLPLRAVRYAPERVGGLENVVSPPYDVIGVGLQQELYARSPYNIVRLDYGRELPGDGPEENRYTRAAQTLRQWMREGILIRDEVPGLYRQEEHYTGEFGEPRVRTGFFARVRLEDPESGMYRPHERTLAAPKADRLSLLRACGAHLSPIFSLYDDPGGEVEQALAGGADSAVLADLTTREGTGVRVWRSSDPGTVDAVRRAMAPRSFFIADGHHRYETALAYRDHMRRVHPEYTGEEPWNFVLMYFSNLWSPGLTVLPTHRGVYGLPPDRTEALLNALPHLFRVESIGGGLEGLLERMRERRGQGHAFGLLLGGHDKPWLLELHHEEIIHRRLSGRIPAQVRGLDVTILHSLVLEELLGVDERAQEEQRHLEYVKDARQLAAAVREGRLQAGFVLNPTRVEEVKAVAEAGFRMPQKSTFFYPKLVTGLLIQLLTDGEPG